MLHARYSKGTCLTIDSFRMEPRSAAVGTKINGVANITVYNQTGTGMTRVDMFTPQVLLLGEGEGGVR